MKKQFFLIKIIFNVYYIVKIKKLSKNLKFLFIPFLIFKNLIANFGEIVLKSKCPFDPSTSKVKNKKC